MNASPPLPTPSRFADRIAWMHAPVHLRCVLLPWFVVRMLEEALHGYLCSLEQALLTLWALHQQGKFDPAPSMAEPEASAAPHASHDKRTFSSVAPAHTAGGAALSSPSEPEMAPAVAGDAEMQPPAWLGVVANGLLGRTGLALPLWGDAWRPDDRCRRSIFFRPAENVWDNCA